MTHPPALPSGFTIELDPTVRRLDGGAALLGGSPPTLLRLAPRARTLLRAGRLSVVDAATARLARTLLDAGVAHPRPRPGTGAAGVTVVVPVRDNPIGLSRLLRALQADADCAEVVVVDDASVAPVRVPAGVRLVRHPSPRGPAAARNRGLAEVSTPCVAFLDSDTAPEPGWLIPLLGHLQDPAVALVAPRIVADPMLGSGWVARYERVRSSLDLGHREARVLPRARVAYVPSAALLVRVDALRGLPGWPGFDESMPVAEDVDLCWRLHAQGWRVRYEPRSTVAHTHRTRTGPWLRRKAFYGTGAAALAQRHPGQVPPVAVAGWSLLACAAAATAGGPGLLVAAGVSAAATARLAQRLPGLRHPRWTALRLGFRGLAGAGWQLSAAAWRHWWPAAALVAASSPRARRTLLVVGVLEGLADWATHRRVDGWAGSGGPGPVVHLLCKRADDLAYGAGLWAGAWRHRSVAALRPRLG
ncbi:MAG: mycofactocin biosynthesis glycosyltransferase MftF [Mycobacteriaceae bacterium]